MIAFSNVTKHYGSKVLYEGASFQINPGEKVGLVGPNGAGKTTVFRIIVGEERVEEGIVSIPQQLKVSYFSQDVADMKGRTVLDEVMAADKAVSTSAAKLRDFEAKLADPELDEDKMNTLLEKYGEAQGQFERLGGYMLETRAREILTGLGIGPDEHGRMTETFSGGWKMRISLAKVLVVNPDLLLIDEPTNHLDMESIIWLEEWLRNFLGAVLMTSHDRDFMNRLVKRVVEVAFKTITVYGGNYDFYERERELRLEQLVASQRRQQDMLAKEEAFIARFAARASHAAQVQSRVKKIEKIDRIEVPTEERAIDFQWPTPPRGGDEVVKFRDLKKIYSTPDGREKNVFEGATALVRRLDRVAVVGVNGAGKSTLLKIITGQTDATGGEISVGPSTSIGYFSQSALDVLDSRKTVIEEVHDRIPQASIAFVRNLLGALKFSGDDAEKRISILSGGEKSRVVLATILAQPRNFLVLDEPTNHLDMASREVLLSALKEFDGTIMIVSHDRYFLRALATRVFEIDRHHLTAYDGGFNYYLEKKGKNAGH